MSQNTDLFLEWCQLGQQLIMVAEEKTRGKYGMTFPAFLKWEMPLSLLSLKTLSVQGL